MGYLIVKTHRPTCHVDTLTLCSPVTSAPSPDIGRRSGLSRKHYYGSLEAVSIQQFTFRRWYLVIYRFSKA